MTDITIHGVREEVLAAIDSKAERRGISRSEYLCRLLERESVTNNATSVAQLETMAVLAADLNDAATMTDAWS
jgi:negative regulator of replication initiation